MYVKPMHDHVPDPERRGYLAAAGRQVEPSPYWWRRVADGDVTEAEPPPPEPPAPPPTAEDKTTESPQTAGSSVSEVRKPNARKGATQ